MDGWLGLLILSLPELYRKYLCLLQVIPMALSIHFSAQKNPLPACTHLWKLQAPRLEEGFDAVYSVTISPECGSVARTEVSEAAPPTQEKMA